LIFNIWTLSIIYTMMLLLIIEKVIIMNQHKIASIVNYDLFIQNSFCEYILIFLIMSSFAGLNFMQIIIAYGLITCAIIINAVVYGGVPIYFWFIFIAIGALIVILNGISLGANVNKNNIVKVHQIISRDQQ